MKVYVITAGEYSDYHICAVTDDPVSAENLRVFYTRGFYSQASIETYETEALPEKPMTCWSCIYSNNDGVINCTEVRYVSKDDAENWDANETKINEVTYSWGHFYVHVFAKDEAHAIKIASEQIYQYKYICESIGKDPWNKPAPEYPTSLASSTVSANVIGNLKEGNSVNGFTLSFNKKGDWSKDPD